MIIVRAAWTVLSLRASDTTDRQQTLVKGGSAFAAFAAVVFLFATQWYAYDATRRAASPYLYYVGWSCLMWAVAPLVLWFARRHPIATHTWFRSVALHVVVSVAFAILQVLIETTFGWLRAQHGLSFQMALSHYFVQHLQLYLFTYWALLAAAEFYRVYDEGRKRQLRAARLETQLSAARLESLRRQLQPHFLFNTLNAAVGLVREDAEGAEDILLRLSQLLRASLTDLQENEITLRKEMEFVDCYVAIQQRRFGERLCVERQFDERLNDFAVPGLILQPLIENAIRHGIGTHKDSDRITIKASLDGSDIVLEVQNLASTLSNTFDRLPSNGIGIANTRARLQELYGERQSMRVFNLEPRGVCVRLTLPARRLGGSDK